MSRCPVCLAVLLALAMPVLALSPDVAAVSVGINEFTFSLFSRLSAASDGNLFCSPYSVSTALAMTYAGARGDTESQMAGVLRLGLDQGHLHPAYRDLEAIVNGMGSAGETELRVANRIWAQPGLPFLDPFLSVIRKDYRADIGFTDFAAQPDVARAEINAWVEKQTRDRIKDLLKPGVLGRETRLALVNAIYFKGFWADSFEERATRNMAFRLGAKSSIQVPMMHRAGDYNYAEEAEVRLVELPYKGGDLSMFVILPKDKADLRAVEKALTADQLQQWLGEMRMQKVELWLPRFRITAEFGLAPVLAAMGMPAAFSGAADFSGMTGARDLSISSVIHKAFVDVNEQGTEAAAATAVIMRLTAMPTSRPAFFLADRPFLFLIRENREKTILFIGRVANPNE